MKYFGTDGIRGLSTFFTAEFLTRVAFATSKLQQRAKIMIARDTRVSGSYIEKELTDALTSYGCDVISCGMTATPVLAYLTKLFNCHFGIMISASHNSAEYNGIKFFENNGGKISTQLEQELEKYIDNASCNNSSKPGRVTTIDGDNLYIEYIIERLSPPLLNMKVLLDTANGATAKVAPLLFQRLGASVDVINNEVCGTRINANCGAVYADNLISIMQDKDYDIAFSYDGDGDRVMAVKKAKLLDGDHIMYIVARYLKECKGRSISGVVGTVMTNMGAEKAFNDLNIAFVRAPVGDKHVQVAMQEHGYMIGGEASGHLIFKDYQNTGDGILSSLILAIIDAQKDILTLDNIVKYSQVSRDILTTADKVEIFKHDRHIAEHIKGMSFDGRVVVRASGTEPRIRIMAEGIDKVTTTQHAEAIKTYILGRIL